MINIFIFSRDNITYYNIVMSAYQRRLYTDLRYFVSGVTEIRIGSYVAVEKNTSLLGVITYCRRVTTDQSESSRHNKIVLKSARDKRHVCVFVSLHAREKKSRFVCCLPE